MTAVDEIYGVVSECKDTRFECNSQLCGIDEKFVNELFQNAKIQDLNVIHNIGWGLPYPLRVVSECKDTRFECNSQRSLPINIKIAVVSECKDTRFECNSQPTYRDGDKCACCFRMQRYKIWM